VDSTEFWPRLVADISGARHRVLIQTLSFEGDSVGLNLAAQLEQSKAPDRRLLVDAFTRVILNDQFLLDPRVWFERPLMDERERTRGLVRRLERAGIGIRFTSPPGPFLVRFAGRNHKKLIVIDEDVAYVGGINFSEHNFAWHDLMLRIEHPAVAHFLAQDFEATWRGESAPRSGHFDCLEISLLDGTENPAGFSGVLQLIRAARRSIFMESPYVTFPFLDALEEASSRGVVVTLVVPENNNWSFFRHAFATLKGSGVQLLLYPGRLTHLKALLVDGEALVLGSSNFDYLSYTLHHETLVTLRHPATIAMFQEKVVQQDTALARPVVPEGDAWRAALLRAELRALAGATRLFGRPPVSEDAVW